MAFAQRPLASLDLGSRQMQAITPFITNTPHKFSTAHSQRKPSNQNKRGFTLLRASASEGSTSSSSSVDVKQPPPQRLPSSTSEIVDQAYTSIKASWVSLLLYINLNHPHHFLYLFGHRNMSFYFSFFHRRLEFVVNA